MGVDLAVGALGVELSTPCPRELIELGVAASVGRSPLGSEPSSCFETMKRGVERALLHLENVLRDLLQALGDSVPVKGTERHDLENQEVERALEQIGFGWAHVIPS